MGKSVCGVKWRKALYTLAIKMFGCIRWSASVVTYKRAVVFECVGSMELSARCVGMHVTCTRCEE